MLDRWCVRCGRNGPTPYIRKNIGLLADPDISDKAIGILDVGCGNGRNSEFLRGLGFWNIMALDMHPTYKNAIRCGTEGIVLGQSELPVSSGVVDLIVATYVMMFLSRSERKQLLSELSRAAKIGCRMVVELYPAKDSETPSAEAVAKLQNELKKSLKLQWDVLKESKDRFIAVKCRPCSVKRV